MESNQCFICQKKLKLIEITTHKCKCGHVFCKKHKEYNDHQCSYNYFQMNSNMLQKELIPIITNKVNYL
uniref:Uncharacterized protein n=1 Tax=viral metagenome TaxID=1070528 RepID=A0A6C0CTT4_9ZZZZ